MKFFNNKIFQIAGICLVIALPIAIAVISWHKTDELKNKHGFTIGIPFKHNIMPDGNELEYYYFVKGEKYIQTQSDFPCEKPKHALHKSFYVMFNPDNPKNSKLLLDYPVSDSITEAPPEGWDIIPGIPDWRQPK